MNDAALHGPWPLVGRDGEVAHAAAMVARGRPLVITGPAGVGKSRLVREVAADLRRAGREIRTAVGTLAAQGIPLGAVAHLVPAAALDAPRDGVLRAIVGALEESRRGPGQLLLAVDDAHLLDDASATLVAHLAHQTDGRSGVVVAARSGHSLPDALRGLATDDLAERIELAPLDELGTDRLLAAGLGAAVDPVTVRLLARWTRGNVLYLRELVRSGIDSGSLRLGHDVWTWHGPPTVGPTLRELIDDRHRRLGDGARTALELVAVGEPVPIEALEGLVEPADLDTLERDGLVERDDVDGRPAIRVSHPLHGESLRRSLPMARANRLRQDLATTIGRTGRPDDRLRRAVLLADAGADAEPAALLAAARRAWALRDTGLVERLALAACRAGPEAEATYLLGEVRADRGDYEGALNDWLELLATELPEELRVRVAIAGSAVLALTLHRADDAAALLDETATRISSAGGAARLHAARSALFLPGRGTSGDARTDADDEHTANDTPDAPAGATADHTDGTENDDLPDQARVFAWLGLARQHLLDGESDAVLDGVDAITRVADRAGEEFPMASMFVGICHFFALMISGRLAEAHARSEQGRESSLMDPLPIAPATWSQGLGIVALARGHLDEASTHLRSAAALLRGNDIGSLRHVLHELALARAIAGDGAAVASALAEATSANRGLIDPFVEVVRVDAALLAAEGDASGARQLLRETLAARSPAVAFYDVPALHDLARFGAPSEARDGLRRWAGRVDGSLVALHLDQAEGLAAGDTAALVAVADRYEAGGYDLDAAETLVAVADLLRQRQPHDRAATAATARAGALLAGCGPDAPRTPMLAGRGPLEALTAREREVALLAAGGSTDNELAERLGLSPRTVHAHLRAVYRKLGVSGRADLARSITDDR